MHSRPHSPRGWLFCSCHKLYLLMPVYNSSLRHLVARHWHQECKGTERSNLSLSSLPTNLSAIQLHFTLDSQLQTQEYPPRLSARSSRDPGPHIRAQASFESPLLNQFDALQMYGR